MSLLSAYCRSAELVADLLLVMNNDKPPYLLVSEALKHLKNKNYGLLETVLLELWERLAEQHHATQDTDS